MLYFQKETGYFEYYEHFTDVSQAISYEKQLKGWSRAKKEALIENNIERLKELSKSKSVDPSPGSG